jgi:hypothetical protein
MTMSDIRLAKSVPTGLKSLGGHKSLAWKMKCVELKKECRKAIREAHEVAEHPIGEYPKAAIKFYEDKGYKAPYWVLKAADKLTRYAA